MSEPMPNNTLLESKKGNSMLIGVLGVMVSGAATVAVAGPAVAITALGYVIGGITAIVTGHIVTQGVQDTKTYSQSK